MTNTYLPGQLYKGRNGDLLYVILPGDEFEFVTNRGTRLSLGEIERVYAPLTLVRPVQGEAPDPGAVAAQELAAAIRDALNAPYAANGAVGDEIRLLAARASHVRGAMRGLADGHSAAAQTAETVRLAAEWHPVTYPTRDEQAGGAL